MPDEGQPTTSYHTHEDRKGVFVRMWAIDVMDGDHAAALLLSQLLWWHRPDLDGQVKLDFQRDGHLWLVRKDDDWERDCRLTTKQVRRIRAVLVMKGFVEHRRFKVNGAPTSAWRPINEAIQAAKTLIRPNPELPPEGNFYSSDPQGEVGSAPPGSLPIPYQEDLKNKISRTTGFDLFYDAYPRRTSPQAARNAWAKATKTTDPSVIIDAACRYRDDPNLPETQFIPHPSKWLNDGRWEDGPLPPRFTNGNGRASPSKSDQRVQEALEWARRQEQSG